MEQKFCDLLIKSTQEVFETMLFMAIEPQPLEANVTQISGLHLSATISIAGEISGSIALHCTRDFVQKCAQAMSGQEGEVSQEEICDTAGELANMIAGSMKRRLSTLIDLFHIALPDILSSSGHTLHFKGEKEDYPRLLIPFVSDEQDRFHVEMLYHRR